MAEISQALLFQASSVLSPSSTQLQWLNGARCCSASRHLHASLGTGAAPSAGQGTATAEGGGGGGGMQPACSLGLRLPFCFKNQPRKQNSSYNSFLAKQLLTVKWPFLYLLVETKIFQEDQDKLVTPFFPICSLYVPVTSSNFLRCGLSTNHWDHYKQACNSAKLQLFFALLLSQELQALVLFCLTGQFQHSSKAVFFERIYIHLCVWSDLSIPCYIVWVKARLHQVGGCYKKGSEMASNI